MNSIELLSYVKRLEKRIEVLESEVNPHPLPTHTVVEGIFVGVYDNLRTMRREVYEHNADGDVVLMRWASAVIISSWPPEDMPTSSWGSYHDVPSIKVVGS